MERRSADRREKLRSNGKREVPIVQENADCLERRDRRSEISGVMPFARQANATPPPTSQAGVDLSAERFMPTPTRG